MKVGAEEQKVERKAPAQEIEVSVDCAGEISELAARLELPARVVRRVIVAFAADVLERKVKGQVARIFKAHLDGILPTSNPAQPTIAFADTLPEAIAALGAQARQ